MSGKKHLSDDLSRLRAERDALAARVKKLEQLEMDTRIVLEGPRPNDAEDVERYNQAVIRTREHFAALDNVSTRGAEW